MDRRVPFVADLPRGSHGRQPRAANSVSSIHFALLLLPTLLCNQSLPAGCASSSLACHHTCPPCPVGGKQGVVDCQEEGGIVDTEPPFDSLP